MTHIAKQSPATRAAARVARPRWSRFQLAAEIKEFLEETGMKQTPFGMNAAGDDKVLWRIENAPNGISLDKADRIRAYMADYRQRAGTAHEHHSPARSKDEAAPA